MLSLELLSIKTSPRIGSNCT